MNPETKSKILIKIVMGKNILPSILPNPEANLNIGPNIFMNEPDAFATLMMLLTKLIIGLAIEKIALVTPLIALKIIPTVFPTVLAAPEMVLNPNFIMPKVISRLFITT